MFDLKTELMGIVWEVCVDIGQVVPAGAPIVILESMKLEIPVAAPFDCTVHELKVEEGAQVAEGQIIALLIQAT